MTDNSKQYERQQKIIAAYIARLEVELIEHALEQKQDHNNTGYTGDLEHVASGLDQLIVFLSDNQETEQAEFDPEYLAMLDARHTFGKSEA
jgi:hypothetical protein